MISQLAYKHADKCRFCWMCRHLCPIQLQTGREINTPRAKGLLLSMVERGAQYDADMAETMYECLLCDACTDNCVSGYQPPLYIREARTEAVVRGIEPEPVARLLENIENTGNIYGEKKPGFGTDDPKEVLVYIGEAAAFGAPDMARAFLELLQLAEIPYMVLAEEPASGIMLGDLIGNVAEVCAQAEACAGALNRSGAMQVVILDSYDAEIMMHRYPDWGCPVKAELVTGTTYIARLLKEGKLKIRQKQEGTASYHDDDRLARTFHEFEPAREICRAMGYAMTEMFNHRELARSCGTSLAKAYMPEMAEKTARSRWNDFLRTDAQILLAANPQVLDCMAQTVPAGKQLEHIYGALERACRR